MKLLIIFLKTVGVAFGITAGIALAICGVYLLAVGVIAFVEFVDRKVGRK